MTAATPAPAPAAPASVPGKTLGIVALILVIPFGLSLVGIILGFVARGQSKKAGAKNTPATVAIVLGFIALIITIVAIAIGVSAAASLAAQCADLGSGVHDMGNGVTITCG
ncbi:MAG: hypothetical protein KF761_13635 [Salinibacterium sp.]|nr:hypothetical protein [Salinibacterium sp.]